MRLNWWKVGLIGTFLWFLVVAGIAAYGIYRIVQEAPAQAEADARAQKMGRAVGTISAPCLAGIWFYAWTRRRREQDPMSLPPARRRTSPRRPQ